MMGDLLSVNKAAIEDGLEGLAQNGIEGLVHLEIGNCCSGREGGYVLHPLDWVFFLCCFFEESGGIGVRLANQ